MIVGVVTCHGRLCDPVLREERESPLRQPPVCLRCQNERPCSNVDKYLYSAFVVIPIAPMAVMLNKIMVIMMLVEPTRSVMVICHGAPRTDDNEEGHHDASD